MDRYEDILNAWFYVLYPKRYRSVEAFEAEDGLDDRTKTAELFVKILAEAPTTARRMFEIDDFPLTVERWLMNTLGGRWRFSRFSNFFTSGIVAGKLEFSIFDSVIKKCSSDFGHESLREKFTAFANLVHTAEHASDTSQ